MTNNANAIGIDVGGVGKGFHAVALHDGAFEPYSSTSIEELGIWCRARAPLVVAIDAPCKWSNGKQPSRLAERQLAIGGKTIQCFRTPTRESATPKPFYGWVFNGEELYEEFNPDFMLFDGTRRDGRVVIETFPHAIMCALAGRLVSARPKVARRREMLRNLGYNDRVLANIDFVDAALCAITAERFLLGRTISFGDADEGLIVVPRSN